MALRRRMARFAPRWRGPFNRDWWLIPLILVDTAPPALPGSARVMEPSNGCFSSPAQLSMKERASLVWESAAQLVEDALSKLLGNNMLFLDRHDAGKQLAERLRALKEENPVVLALPRGGVSVGFEVVRVLAAPLDLVVVGKIGAPFEAELAIGAIADGADPELVTDPLFIAGLDISPEYLEESKAAVLREIERRRRVYLGNRPPLEVAGRTVIIVDDGIATGATMLAALRATRRRRPAQIVLAVPVASKATLKRLREEADQIVCVATPRNWRGARWCRLAPQPGCLCPHQRRRTS
jgi:putative phosphoribosyl transferase